MWSDVISLTPTTTSLDYASINKLSSQTLISFKQAHCADGMGHAFRRLQRVACKQSHIVCAILQGRTFWQALRWRLGELINVYVATTLRINEYSQSDFGFHPKVQLNNTFAVQNIIKVESDHQISVSRAIDFINSPVRDWAILTKHGFSLFLVLAGEYTQFAHLLVSGGQRTVLPWAHSREVESTFCICNRK